MMYCLPNSEAAVRLPGAADMAKQCPLDLEGALADMAALKLIDCKIISHSMLMAAIGYQNRYRHYLQMLTFDFPTQTGVNDP